MFRVVDLFAGCGGLLEGFKRTGYYETVACVEWEKSQVQNLRQRLKDKWQYQDADRKVLHFDIQRSEELFEGWSDDPEYGSHCGLDQLVEEANGVDLIIGGPPCQAYSMAGRVRDENGMRDDYRNFLFESYLRVVDRYQPKLIIFENVPGMLSAKPGDVPVTQLIREAFDRSGYDLVEDFREQALLDLTDFGVPQKRKRVILLGLRRNSFPEGTGQLLNSFYSDVLDQYKVLNKQTVRDTIADLPKFYPTREYKVSGKNFSHTPQNSEVPNHIPRYHNRRDIEIFRILAEDILSGNSRYVTTEALKKLYTEQTGKTSNVHKYYVLRWDEQSNTIPAHLYKDGLRHIHPDPEQARSLTIREAARLQTFDDDYAFLGSPGDQYKMIGNAVPPLFSYCLAQSVNDLLTQSFFESKEDKTRI